MNSLLPSFDTSTRRGQTEVLGFALLLGIGVGSGVFMLAIGASPLEDIEGQTNEQQAQSGFSAMSSNVTNVGLSGSETSNTIDASFTRADEDIEVSGDGTVTVRSVDADGNKTQVLQNDLGYMKYETSTGTTLYYQNGGIWKQFDNEQGIERITTPEFHYEDQTVTFPVIQIVPKDSTVSGSYQATHTGTSRTTEQLYVDDQIIEIEITGPLYRGWGNYFNEEIQGSTVEYDDENETVLVKLGTRSQTLDSFQDAALSGGNINLDHPNAEIRGNASARETVDGRGTVTGNVEENTDYTLLPMDSVIESNIDSADTTLNSLDGKTLKDGSYVIGDTTMRNGNVTVDLSEGDVTLAVDGSLNIRNNSTINVINPSGGSFEVFVKDDFYMTNGGPVWTVENSRSDKNIVYASKSSKVHFGNQAEFTGVLYAPSTETTTGQSGSSSGNGNGNGNGNGGGGGSGGTGGCSTVGSAVCISVNTQINGAIVAGSTTMKQNSVIDYDEENLSDFAFDVDLGDDANTRPELTFFHSSNTRIEISED